jgi:hypothetical protein
VLPRSQELLPIGSRGPGVSYCSFFFFYKKKYKFKLMFGPPLPKLATVAASWAQGCHADVFGRTDGRTDDGRGGVRDLDAL